MLTYSFADTGSDSLYIHLHKCIKNDMLSGALACGIRLPSKGSFAKNLGISNITVGNAYAQLQSEGYIYSVPKKGFYVSDIPSMSYRRPVACQPGFRQPDAGKAYLADLVSNKTAPESFPFSVWAKLMRKIISEKSEGLMTNPPAGGIMELRTAIRRHLKQFRNIIAEPQQIIIGAGTEYLYSLIIQLLGRDRIYALEDPGYRKIDQIYKSIGAECRYAPLGRSGIMISRLEDIGAEIAHISPSHHYPTGIVMPAGRRYELLGWAAKEKNRYIIEDDYDSEFRLTGKPIPALRSIDMTEKVIYMNSFTKSLASTIRISYMILPAYLYPKKKPDWISFSKSPQMSPVRSL